MSTDVKQLPKRSELPVQDTWDLTKIFKTDEDWEIEYKALQQDIPKIQAFQGKLNESAKTLLEALQLQDQLSERLGALYTYAHMRNDEDTTNSFYQALNQKAGRILSELSSAMSFITPEILSIDEKILEQYQKEESGLAGYKRSFEEIARQRDHVLSEKEETLLAKAGDALGAASETFSILNNADLKFPVIEDEDGNKVELTHGRYLGFMESKNRDVRKSAFEAMYETYGKYKNTFGTTLSGNVKKNNFYAEVRNYPSARAASLGGNDIPETVYDGLVEAINEKLPLLHRYTELRKEILNVDTLHMYDLYTPLLEHVDMKVSYEDAKDYTLKGLAPLGSDYTRVLEEAFSNRWIDVYENVGKRSGAYSSGSYSTDPFILLNWQDAVNDLFTLVHELGHSVHSYYTRKHQPFRYGNYSIFVAEVASTVNENLLSEYLLNTLEDKDERLYILNHYLEAFRGTVFRQTMFAEFEHQIHELSRNGEALTADYLSEIYYELNKKYFGTGVVSDEEIALEWARIPHFYYNYYVYQYATGFAAATTLTDRILTEKEPAVNRYLDFLKAGSSESSIDVLKKAGVDMTEKAPILKALDIFEEKLTEFESLIK